MWLLLLPLPAVAVEVDAITRAAADARSTRAAVGLAGTS